MTSILCEKDLSKFKKKEHNRDLVRENVDKIKFSISTKNLLKLRPILVNEQMEVLDGQHRLQACKELQIPIYYSISPEIKTEDIILLNIQRRWSLDDYQNYYVQDGRPDYIEMKKFTTKHNLKVSSSARYLGLGQGAFVTQFKSGKFIFPSQGKIEIVEQRLEKLNEILLIISEQKIKPKVLIKSLRFKESMISFMNDERIDFDIFKKKIKININRLNPCSSTGDYNQLLKDIYNWKNQNPVME